jgi:molybdenum cofactor guanylyltransferase
MAHQKHNKLARSTQGDFGKNEWAFLGTDCASIQKTCLDLARALPGFKIGYVDADHKSAGKSEENSTFALEYTDKIEFQRIDLPNDQPLWARRIHASQCSLLFLNGNHFKGERQVVFLDRRKFDSLARKTERLDRVVLFLRDEKDLNAPLPAALPEAVRAAIPNFQHIPVLNQGDIAAITQFITKNSPPPPLAALILAGGRSLRMGQDKAGLTYHGNVPQWQQ